jgi:hypothetical protein
MPTHVINEVTTDVQLPVFEKIITLTDPQIKSLPTNPIMITDAKGDGKAAVVIQWAFSKNFIAPYTLSGGSSADDSDFGVSWGPNEANATQFVIGVFGNTSQNIHFQAGTPAISGGVSCNFPETYANNKGLYLATDSADGENYIGGDSENTLTITVLYLIVDL